MKKDEKTAFRSQNPGVRSQKGKTAFSTQKAESNKEKVKRKKGKKRIQTTETQNTEFRRQEGRQVFGH